MKLQSAFIHFHYAMANRFCTSLLLHFLPNKITDKTSDEVFETGSEKPIWILGLKYQPGPLSKKFKRKKQIRSSNSNPNSPVPTAQDNPFDEDDDDFHHVADSDLEEFSQFQYQSLTADFESLLWFSYRKEFPPITNELKRIEPMTMAPMNKNGEIEGGGLCYYTTPQKSRSKTPDESTEGYTSSLTRIYHSMVSYTSDAGWGCMMRSGQMMLGQAFVHYYLGRGFRLPPDDNQMNMYQMILSWFLDREEAPYSIHRIAQAGTLFNKKVGEWFGPSTIATVLQ
jgi:hypothetical protein